MENPNTTAGTGGTSAVSSSLTGLNLILGAMPFEAQFRDGTKEQVGIRSLSPKLLQRWGSLQGDESSLVELYCGRFNASAHFKLKNLQAHEQSIFVGLAETKDADEIAKLREKLDEVQGKILELEDIERWSDKLTPESHDEIYRIGEAINRPRYEQWTENTRASTALLQEQFRKLARLNGSTLNGSSPDSSSGPDGAGKS